MSRSLASVKGLVQTPLSQRGIQLSHVHTIRAHKKPTGFNRLKAPAIIWLPRLPPVATKRTHPEQLIHPHIQLSKGTNSGGEIAATQ